jgi:alginate O-acetyltransferase complex protein AlgI
MSFFIIIPKNYKEIDHKFVIIKVDYLKDGRKHMVFSNLVFLFAFLPTVMFFYFIVKKELKNVVLILSSLFFYAWGEPKYIVLMLFSIVINYAYGIWIENSHSNEKRKLWILTSAIIVNIGLLGYFKYANFFVGIIDSALHLHIKMQHIPLPIGISFYTFHSLSYLIDVYRKKEEAQKSVFNLALYISLFPQLVAGPIIRYNNVSDQLAKREVSIDQIAEGIQRFILGLTKKVFLANTFGSIADQIFASNTNNLSIAVSWIGIIAYTLQIYFDFSGYSDMAIGLGKMFGFNFAENFNYPYVSKSISEFWRRWHISLGTWFKDYLYIPLGGNRGSGFKTVRNLLIVWTVTGFWHGASWTFMAWGFYYGVLIVLERLWLGAILEKLWKPIQHLYVIVLVMIGWVFFRADSFGYSFQYIKTMFGLNQKVIVDSQFHILWNDNWYMFVLGFIFSTPIFIHLNHYIKNKIKDIYVINGFFQATKYFVCMVLMVVCMILLVNSTYNPFIYFRF